MRLFYLFLAMILVANNMFAQIPATLPVKTIAPAKPKRTIVGKVLNYKDSLGLEGVDVFVRGNIRTYSTNAAGQFELPYLKTDSTIILSYPGLATMEVSIPEDGDDDDEVVGIVKEMKIVMVPELQPVNVGFGGEYKSALKNSISGIGQERFEFGTQSHFLNALPGTMAGVQVVQASGAANAAPTVRIRGINSLFAGSEPLYVVDGLPIISGTNGDGGGTIGYVYGVQTSPLTEINPSDIDNIQVLKDASTTIYGARGGNGVILIETKKGKPGRTQINVGYQTSVSNPTNKVKTLDGTGYTNELKNSYQNTLNKFPGAPVQPFDSLINYNGSQYQNAIIDPVSGNLKPYLNSSNLANTDWMNQLLRTGTQNEMTLNVLGGNRRVNFFVGGSYLSNKGILIDNDYDRISLRFNADNKATDNLTLGIRSNLSFSNANLPVGGDYGLGGFRQAQTGALPIYPVTYGDNPNEGSLPIGTNPYFNAYTGSNTVLLSNPKDFNKERQIFRNSIMLYAEYNFNNIKGLSFRSEFGIDYYSSTDRGYLSKKARLGLRTNVDLLGNPIVTIETQDAFVDQRNLFTTINSNNYFRYKKDFSNAHHLTFELGHQYSKTFNKYNGVIAFRSSTDYSKLASAGSVRGKPIGGESGSVFLGYFGKINYDYQEKYYLGFISRIDASSRYGRDISYIYSPAVSAAWALKKEKALIDISALDDLKLRSSIGLSQNSLFGDFLNSGYYVGGDAYSNGNIGLGITSFQGEFPFLINNSKLKPESIINFDLSSDFSLWRNKLYGTISYYLKQNNNALLQYPFIPSSGVSGAYFTTNGGKLRSTGLELTIGTVQKVGQVEWNGEVNATFNSSKIISTDVLTPSQVGTSFDYTRLQEGYTPGAFFLPVYGGLNAKGEEMTLGKDGSLFRADSVSQLNDNRVLSDKSPLPLVYGGFNNTFKYKNFEINLFFNYSYGGHVVDYTRFFQSYLSGENNLRQDVVNSTDQPIRYLNGTLTGGTNSDGSPTTYTDPYSLMPSSRFIEDVSFLRLKSLCFAYNLPKHVCKKTRLVSCKFYVKTQNLLTFTAFRGWDPEIASNRQSVSQNNFGYAVSNFDLPQLQSFTLGINIGI